MLRNLLIRCGLLVAALLPASWARAETIAIVGIDVLPMAGPVRLANQIVLIEGDRIRAVGPRGRISVPAGARRIDGSGLTLMPGLVDMHVHLAPEPGRPGDAAQRALAVMLGHGTTVARGMAGSPANLAVRESVESGSLAGPRFYAAAPALHLNNTANAEAARQAVTAARTAGYDLIKSHHLVDVATWQAVQQGARAGRLPVAGHVTNQVGLARAMAAGQQVEHLDGVLFELLPADAPERQVPFGQVPPPPVLAALSGVTDARIDALARQAAAAGSWHVPTLALFERLVSGRPVEELLAAPFMRWVPEAAARQWETQYRAFDAQSGYSSADRAALRDLRRRIVRAFHRRGVPIMAGSDTAQSFHIWGPGLIDEIEALAAAGLPPMAALRSATVVPRDYLRSLPGQGSHLGWRADFGTVEPGARADLILLRGDPSRDLANLRRLETVIAAGRVHDRAALDAMLDRAAQDARPS